MLFYPKFSDIRAIARYGRCYPRESSRCYAVGVVWDVVDSCWSWGDA
jgi:hypothetical protein